MKSISYDAKSNQKSPKGSTFINRIISNVSPKNVSNKTNYHLNNMSPRTHMDYANEPNNILKREANFSSTRKKDMEPLEFQRMKNRPDNLFGIKKLY